jgi:CRP/FNR family cyclic AMP-dependent transcriptional regulator
MAISTIRSIPFFNGLAEDVLTTISNNARSVDFKAGHTLLKSKETPGYVMLILSGTVQLNEQAEDGRVIDISFCGKNDLLAWLSIIDGKANNQTITTLSQCSLLIFPIVLMQNLVANNSLLASRFLMLSANAIRRLSQARAMLSLPNAFHRVFVQISMLSAGTDSGSTSLPKQQDIANSVNTSRETVSRALQMLIKSGVLHKVGHQIVVKKADTLKKLAMDGPESIPLAKS